MRKSVGRRVEVLRSRRTNEAIGGETAWLLGRRDTFDDDVSRCSWRVLITNDKSSRFSLLFCCTLFSANLFPRLFLARNVEY